MADDGGVRATQGLARGVPAGQRDAKSFTWDEFGRWARENPETFQRLADMGLPEADLYTRLSKEIARARVYWPPTIKDFTMPIEKAPKIEPRTDRPSELRAARDSEPGEVQLTGPDGVLYTVSEESYQWMEGLRRRAVAVEYAENLAGAFVGLSQRPSPGPPPSTRPNITKVEQGIIRPAAQLPRKPQLSPRTPAHPSSNGSVPELPLTIPRETSRTVPPPSTRPPISQVDRGLARPPTPLRNDPQLPPRAPARVSPTAAPDAESVSANTGAMQEQQLKIPRGMSRNEVLEPRSRDTSHPNADLVNAKQPALDLIDGTRLTTWARKMLKGGRLQIVQATVGGEWIQLKRLEEEGAVRVDGTKVSPVKPRIKNNLDFAIKKFDAVLTKGASEQTNTKRDGTRVTQIYEKPGSLHVSIEIENLAPGQVQHLQSHADRLLSDLTTSYGYQTNTVMGVPVTVSVRKAP